eukprot:TRINITY_DN8241_c0_g1_i3.p1 TRINITY_DN8241_c0_g1~~TRINITY_DN8241_c0_g1_i3.p1  ORF type:complete len:265 (-),score=29.97 TRINITY_DN8241_c0_g1_i3:281-1075(-)
MPRVTKNIVLQYSSAASGLVSAKAQLIDCLAHEHETAGILLWIIGNPHWFSPACESLHGLEAPVGQVGALLRSIEQPVVGLVLGCVGPLASELLRACDHVVAASSAEFSTDEHGCLSVEDAIQIGLAHKVVREMDLPKACDIMVRMFEIHSLSELAALKSTFCVGGWRATPGKCGAPWEKQVASVPALPKLLPPPSCLGVLPLQHGGSSLSHQVLAAPMLPFEETGSHAIPSSSETSDEDLTPVSGDDRYMSRVACTWVGVEQK